MTVVASTEFPENMLDVLRERFELIPDVSGVVLRNINIQDANGTIAIALDEWVPQEYEINGLQNFEPTTAVYNVAIAHISKVANREDGATEAKKVAKAIRTMLYRDPLVAVALRQLHEDFDDGRRERLLQWKITSVQHASNEIDKTFVNLSVTQMTFTTETV